MPLIAGRRSNCRFKPWLASAGTTHGRGCEWRCIDASLATQLVSLGCPQLLKLRTDPPTHAPNSQFTDSSLAKVYQISRACAG